MYVIRLWTDIFAVIIQSISKLKPLIYWSSVQAGCGLILQLLLVPLYGIYGTVIAMTTSWVITVSWVLPKIVYKVFKEKESEC